jgi:hypothetical protein
MEGEKEIKKLIDNFYSIISGKEEEERDWNSFRTLFYGNAHLTSTRFNSNNECIAIPKDVESYISGLDKFLKSNEFYEYGFNYEISIIGNISQVHSEYEAKKSLKDNNPIKKGVNLVQLINDGHRWRIVSMLWEDI